MNLARRVMTLPGRWHRSRGFGIHSPFAFDFVTNVLRRRRGYGLYADERLGRVTPAGDVAFAMLVSRVAAALAPARVAATAPVAWLDAACGAAVSSAGHVDSLLVVPDVADDAAIARALATVMEQGGAVVARRDDGRLRRRLIGSMTSGMTFATGSGTLVAVGRRDLPLNHFDLHFQG